MIMRGKLEQTLLKLRKVEEGSTNVRTVQPI
jgi:hypothetical protein